MGLPIAGNLRNFAESGNVKRRVIGDPRSSVTKRIRFSLRKLKPKADFDFFEPVSQSVVMAKGAARKCQKFGR